MQPLRATYRFQFNEQFRLTDALVLVPYLRDLGISHIYASPLFKACPHSNHGYDVCDFGELNPEIGTDADLEKLAATLQANHMGLIVDIVPNHMGTCVPANNWWWDVLKNGVASRYARHFDINWESSDENLRRKVLLPVLGDKYGDVLQRGELKIAEEKDGYVVQYFDHRFPVAPNSLPKTLVLEEINSDRKILDELLQSQHYLLADWREADERLNYRRFFAVSSLAGVRVEDDKVFAMVHPLLHRWVEKGWIDGIRVDHPDGLREPEKYLRHLRALAPNQWIVVEKILQLHEDLPGKWPVQGTTGYDFLNQVNGLFINSVNETTLTDFYVEFADEPTDAGLMAHEEKRLVLETLFRTETNRLVGMLCKILPQRYPDEEFSSTDISEAFLEFAASFPVYRSYVSVEKKTIDAQDQRVIQTAAAKARGLNPALPAELFDIFTALLTLKFSGELEDDFTARFQQLTSAVMAKGVEDTVFYCFNRFVSLNEVGGDPGRFGISPAEFHEFCQRQQAQSPKTMLASSTHDIKRSEDVRARLNVLSEIPGIWRDTVLRWSAMNERYHEHHFPDRNAEYLFYQSLVGAWPISVERLTAYMEKASYEAKQHTDWNDHNQDYDVALKKFITSTLANPAFISDLEDFLSRIESSGHINSLAQTLVRLTAPGIPDLYQGNELWDFSLVDPDNRRPVDFSSRQKLLAEAKNLDTTAIWNRRSEGLPKLWLIYKTLNRRAQNPDYFDGIYEPLLAVGEKASHVVAFIRGGMAITIVPRFIHELDGRWSDTALELPAGSWRNEFTGETLTGKIAVKELFKHFPVSLLVKMERN